MGLVKITCTIGNPLGTVRKDELFVVDTGAFYTIISPSLARELGISSSGTTDLTLANNRTVKADIGIAYLKILDREGLLPVAIMDAPLPLLGATALEGLGLMVDPHTGRVEHSRPFGLAAL